MSSLILRHFQALDGVASTSELRERGVGRRRLIEALESGAVRRIRRG